MQIHNIKYLWSITLTVGNMELDSYAKILKAPHRIIKTGIKLGHLQNWKGIIEAFI